MRNLYLILFLLLGGGYVSAQTTVLDTVLTDFARPNRMVTDGNTLYFTANNQVLSLDLSVNTPTPDTVITFPTFGELTDIIILGNDLYVGRFEFSGTNLFKIDLTENQPASIDVITNFARINGLIESDSTLYFTTSDDGSVWSYDLRADAPSPQLIVDGLEFPGPLSLVGTDLYVSVLLADQVVKIDLAMSPAAAEVVIPSIPRPIGQLQIDDQLIVPSLIGGYVLAFSLADFSATPDTLAFVDRPIDIIKIGRDLYLSRIPSAGTGQILRIPAPLLAGELCSNAIDIQTLFGQEIGVAQNSTLYDNTDYNADGDPDFGFECFGEPDTFSPPNPTLDRTIWFSFTGDGNSYEIATARCDATNYISFGDTQIAIYTGDCSDPTAVVCAEDFDTQGSIFEARFQFPTQEGVEYQMLVDGFGENFPGIGEFCLEITQLGPSSVTDVQDTPIRLFPNPTDGLIQLSDLNVERVAVFNQMGSRVATFERPGNRLNIGDLPTGIYLLRMEDEEGKLFSARVVKH